MNKKKFIFIDVSSKITDFIINSILTIYLLEKGLSFIEISLLWTLFMATTAITDYPTGGLADKFGRRKIHSIGLILSGISYLLLFDNQYFFILVWLSHFIKGISASQITGSLPAWLNASTKSRDNYISILKSSEKSSIFINFFLAIVLYVLNPNIAMINNIILTCGVFNILIGCLTVILLKENYGSKNNINSIFMEGFSVLKKNKGIQTITVISSIMYVLTSSYMLLWQPLLFSITGNVRWNSLIISTSSLFVVVGIKIYSDKIKNNILYYLLIQLLSYIMFLCTLRTGYFLFFIIAMFFQSVSNGIRSLLVSDGVKQYSTSTEIATITSLISSISMLIGLTFQIIFGIIVDSFGITGLVFITIIIILIVIVIMLYKFKVEKKPNLNG